MDKTENQIVDGYALYNNTSSGGTELAFKVGDKVTVICREDPDWWFGEINNTFGYFPFKARELLVQA